MPRRDVSTWAIDNPIAAIVIFLILTFGGLIALPGLAVNNAPDVELPLVSIIVADPGSAPQELEALVTRRVEDAVAGLADVRNISSRIEDGLSTTLIEFKYGTGIDRVTAEVRNRIAQIRSDLPATIREPVITKVEANGGAIVTYTLAAPHLTVAEQSWFVDDVLARALRALPGVADVSRLGGVSREIRVALTPERLLALDITASQVNDQLRQSAVDLPAGRGNLGTSEQAVRTLAAARSVEELASRPIVLPAARVARLGDLADISDGSAEARTIALLNGQAVVAFEVLRTRSASELKVAEVVARKLRDIERQHEGVRITLASGTTGFVLAAYHGALEALAVGAVLTVLVVWVFLRDSRATLIAAIAMPLSLIPTFLVMSWCGLTLNNVTLLGLTLVVGVLVDDAIVEVENTVRHMHEHPTIDVRSAAKAAASEIGLAVLATTVTILAVFVPVTFIPGLPGRYFREFGLTVASAVFFSLLVARLLTPVMCGAWLRRGGRQVAEHPVRRHAFIGGYAALSRLSLKYRWVTLSAAGLFFAGAILVMRYLPQDFVAASDRSRTVMLLEMDPGTSLAETTAAVGRATRLLLDRPEVQAVFAVVGATSFLGGVGSGSVTRTAETNVALLTVPLVPRRERALSQGQFEASIRSVLQTIPGARVQSGADGAPGARLNVTLVSRDPSALNQAARDLERQMRDIPGLGGARTGASLERPEILIKPLLAQAAELGVSPVAIATTARIATLGDSMQNLARFNLTDRQVAIRVMLPEETRADLRHLARLRVETHNGSAVPLDAVADIEHGSGLARIERLDRLRAARIETELQGLPFGEAMRLIRETAAMRNLPEGVTERPADDAELLEEMNAGFAVALITGIGLVYLVLVLLFSSFSLPLTIMTALPLSLGGALIALVLAQKPLGLSAIIGTLMLMGIVAKNSILLVEHAIDAQRRGMAREAALLDAAATRARPIIMTSLAMIAGMLHIAAGIGADAEFRSPMALVLVGGLITSTILSLIVVPAAYTVVDDAAGLAGRAGRRLKSYRAGTER